MSRAVRGRVDPPHVSLRARLPSGEALQRQPAQRAERERQAGQVQQRAADVAGVVERRVEGVEGGLEGE